MTGGKAKSGTEASQPAFSSMLEQIGLPEPVNVLLDIISREGVKKRRSGPPKATHAEHVTMREDKGQGKRVLTILPKDGE